MGKIFPVLLMIVGLVGGGSAGYFMQPEPAEMIPCEETNGKAQEEDQCVEISSDTESVKSSGNIETSSLGYVKLTKQFVVPVLKENRVTALVVMSLSIEITDSMSEMVYDKEPKLRDSFLKVMLAHANSGGFEGQFTTGEPMKDLRGSLQEAAQEILGYDVTDVLVTDILRQDV